MTFSEVDGMWYHYSEDKKKYQEVKKTCNNMMRSRLAILKSFYQIQLVLEYFDRLGKITISDLIWFDVFESPTNVVISKKERM